MPKNSNKTKQHYTARNLTRALIELYQVPKPERDNDWHKSKRLVQATLQATLNDTVIQGLVTQVRKNLTRWLQFSDDRQVMLIRNCQIYNCDPTGIQITR